MKGEQMDVENMKKMLNEAFEKEKKKEVMIDFNSEKYKTAVSEAIEQSCTEQED